MSRAARPGRPAGLVPGRPQKAARTPFVLLVVVLLGSGMLGLLLLNAAVNEGSFELSKLKRETQELTDEQQALQAEVDAFSAPAALAERARRMGMVPGGPPAFLSPDGTVLGDASPAPAPPQEEPQNGEEVPEQAGEAAGGAEEGAEPPPPAVPADEAGVTAGTEDGQ
ncbi:hypothetical protein GCM10009716_31000 [Streptomyces sodiiphilus]|uniref:Cell division protein FtsL n=1 Tax=Streptomyces sodiiphilus TaxID=226217 RepID=A0ABP5ASY3_9ACTN